ncbi:MULTISPECIES: pseudouridine synthase [unclassified Acinetobacter]|uniref:pseudouridine synthase n=1 Tax=unclassified Acinetobacter TaxID=196816 RepID=UPI00190B751C|nr:MULTISPECIES: pseudouridine synthase [unclassified Acinetobacter]MBK0064932.1 RNA pseudouridine synthase [Acinetobacter sp. S55]MBK0068245.1 RNA pseudouridine synthase [Acinetobacter sp. S54]
MSSHHFIYQPPLDPLETVYEDADFIVVDKPAGLLSVMGRLPQHQDSAYLRVLKQYPHARVTHRLDMATSGLLMFAKHRQAEIAMGKIFQARTIKKYYVALVQGQIVDKGCVDVPLITDWPNRPKQKVDYEQGKHAKTLYQLLDYDHENQCSRILLEPVTGRSHQLRVHMQHLGHPILGDKLYHPTPFACALQRMALHATSLTFTQPFSEVEVQLEIKAPF